MITNYLKIAIRHIQKHKFYSLINISGLIIAFTCSMLIFLYVKYELSYDRYHENADNIYRVVQRQTGNEWRGTEMWNATSAMLKPTIMEEIPEVENAVTIHHYGYAAQIHHNGKHYPEQRYYVVEPEFLEIFSVPLIKGDLKTALNEPRSIMLTESMVRKYFGDNDPMGKTINVNNIDHTVTGVLKDVPKNSHFTFDFLASFLNWNATEWEGNQGGFRTWSSNNFNTYIQVQDNVDPVILAEKITSVVNQYKDRVPPTSHHLQKITDIHLHSHVNREFEANGNIRYIYIFSFIAILILLVASFNYMNLSTVQTLFFVKEVGVRKISGANWKQISFQYFGEAIIFTLSAILISILIVTIILPDYSGFVERDLQFMTLLDPLTAVLIFAVAIIAGLLSGSYPSIVLSRQRPAAALKNNSTKGSGGVGFRNSLIVFQFGVSIAMIICTIVLFKQLNFVKSKELGFQKENIVNIPTEDIDFRKKYNVFKDELKKHPGIADVIYTNTTLNFNMWGGGAWWEGKSPDDYVNFYVIYTDYNFFDFYGINIIEGRSFNEETGTDGPGSYILNKATINALGWNNPVGKKFNHNDPLGEVIGVCDNFHYQSLHLNIEPMVIKLGQPEHIGEYISVKLNSPDIKGALDYIEDTYNEFSPGYDFNYKFLDEQLDASYKSEQRQGVIFSLFTIIAMIIAGLGLFGLAAFMAKQRTKEIGIRKVNGAKVTEMLSLLNKDFIKWVIIAFVIACPIAYSVMNMWLENFAYKTTLSWWILALAGLLALGIALLTVSWQSWRAANRNPVEALRYE